MPPLAMPGLPAAMTRAASPGAATSVPAPFSTATAPRLAASAATAP